MQDKEWLARHSAAVAAFQAENPDHAAMPGPVSAAGRPKHPNDALNQAQRTLWRDRALLEAAPRAIAVHCTHGFNRSGYALVHYAKRMCPTMSVATCLQQCAVAPASLMLADSDALPPCAHCHVQTPKAEHKGSYGGAIWHARIVPADATCCCACRFVEAREPGLYKDDYIQALFDYFHEARPEAGPNAILTPMEPIWKPEGRSPERFDTDAAADNGGVSAGEGKRMQHDDDFAEEIREEEADMYRAEVLDKVHAAHFCEVRSSHSALLTRAQFAARADTLQAPL